MAMSSEDVMRVLGLSSLPSDPADRQELLESTEVLVAKQGEAWVSEHKRLLRGQYEVFTGVKLNPSEE